MRNAFVEAVNDSDWALALSLLAAADAPGSVHCASPSIPAWLVEVNAPPHVVIECQKLLASADKVKEDAFGLLALCVSLGNTKSNAYPTFTALLSDGVSPNGIVCGGETLLQYAVSLNRVREVEQLLRHGVDPDQMNVFGRESNSNREGVKNFDNEAGRLAQAWFSGR